MLVLPRDSDPLVPLAGFGLQVVTRVKLEQASKVKSWMPTRLLTGEGRAVAVGSGIHVVHTGPSAVRVRVWCMVRAGVTDGRPRGSGRRTFERIGLHRSFGAKPS